MKRLVLCALVVCLPVAAVAKKQHEMHTAKVISQETETSDGGTAVMPLAGGLVGVPLTRRSNVVVIQTQHHTSTLVEVGRRTLVLTVNGTTQYYRDGRWVVMLDTAGHKHKFAIMHDELRDDAAQE